jgi:negative regulator of flagellin synthesis FlgM
MINGIGNSAGSLSGVGGRGSVTGGKGVAGRSGLTSAAEDRGAVTTIFAQIAAAGAPIDTDRVTALRNAIRAGTYRADPEAIAGTMIDTDLGVSSK